MNQNGNYINQSDASIEKNKTFFFDQQQKYRDAVNSMDTYVNMRKAIDSSVSSLQNLCDIGNGGTFDYNTDSIKSILAVDLCFENGIPAGSPKNISYKPGSALNLPCADAAFDGALMVMLLHHLTGETVSHAYVNMKRSIDEAYRILQPGGKLVIVESCLPKAFHIMEKAVYPAIYWGINKFLRHPPTFQFTVDDIAGEVKTIFGNCETLDIKRGNWQMFLGFKLPTALLPTFPTLFSAVKAF